MQQAGREGGGTVEEGEEGMEGAGEQAAFEGLSSFYGSVWGASVAATSHLKLRESAPCECCDTRAACEGARQRQVRIGKRRGTALSWEGGEGGNTHTAPRPLRGNTTDSTWTPTTSHRQSGNVQYL